MTNQMNYEIYRQKERRVQFSRSHDEMTKELFEIKLKIGF